MLTETTLSTLNDRAAVALGSHSMDPISGTVDPLRVSATHQSLHHIVAKVEWSDQALLAAVRGVVVP